MLWSDAWTLVATEQRGHPYNTTLPPPVPRVPDGVTFRCVHWGALTDAEREEWITVVGTGWTATELTVRLQDAWIPLLYDGAALVGTAVFRPRLGGKEAQWLLETLRVVTGKRGRGWGRLLMEAGRRWLWDHGGGPFVLAFVWELSVPGLVGAWLRGWMRSAAAVQRGWVFAVSGCGFCPVSRHRDSGDEVLGTSRFRPHEIPARTGQPLRPAAPLHVQTGADAWAIVNDSGAEDGWGHVCQWSGVVDWTAVAKKGGWGRLWARSSAAPSTEWRWSGEFVVVAALNGRPVLEWVTPEIA